MSAIKRPLRRSDCEALARPCRRRTCRHHLPGGECTLDLAATGPRTLREIGAALHLSHERVRTIEQTALAKLRRVISRTWDR